jgi:hypothetical protein
MASLRERSDAYYAAQPTMWHAQIDSKVKCAVKTRLDEAADSGDYALHVTMSRDASKCAIMEKYAAATKPLKNGAVLQYTPMTTNNRECTLWFTW